MKSRIHVLVLVSLCISLAGCVSTTTGTAPPEANDGDAASLNYQLGARYYRNGNFELARDRLLLALELDPDMAIAWSTLALTYEQLQNPRLARDSYRRAMNTAPRDYNVLNAYAVFLCRQGDFDDARKYFDRAAGIPENDNSFITLTNAGVCMSQKPDLAQAEVYFREALERRANYGEALFQLSLMKHKLGDSLSARAFLERYLSANVPNATVLFLGVQIEDKLGDQRARSNYVNQLLNDFPDSPEARRVLDNS